MKLLLILGAVVIIALILKAFRSQNGVTPDAPRANAISRPQTITENDKLIIVTDATQEDIKKTLTAFCKTYNKGANPPVPRLYQITPGKYAITFPYDLDFVTFCFAINFLKYPPDVQWHAKVRGWATTHPDDKWITEKSMNKKVMLFIPDDDKGYDNVYLTTQDNIGYKLGFAAGEEKQLLTLAKEPYVQPTINYADIEGLKFDDFH
jgi:hypothetical protein